MEQQDENLRQDVGAEQHEEHNCLEGSKENDQDDEYSEDQDDEDFEDQDDEDFEDQDDDEVIEELDDKITALTELLIEKNIITQEEIDKKIETYYEEVQESDDSDAQQQD